MRVLIGAPLRRPPKHQIILDTLMDDSETASLHTEISSGLVHEEKPLRPEGLGDVLIFCTSDFTTVSKEVHIRTRRVRLLGLEVFSL